MEGDSVSQDSCRRNIFETSINILPVLKPLYSGGEFLVGIRQGDENEEVNRSFFPTNLQGEYVAHSAEACSRGALP